MTILAEPEVNVVTDGPQPLTLHAAILLYGSANEPAYARLHRVLVSNGRPTIEAAGHALTIEGLAAACRSLLGAKALAFLDPHLLVDRDGFRAWWRPPGVARVLFQCAELGGRRRGRVPMPGLVFVNSGTSVFIVAVKGRQRPTMTDQVFAAPLFNHYEDGRVCNGSVRFEAGLRAEEIERRYWSSYFTAPNQRRVHTLHRDGFYSLWRKLLDGHWKRFPASTLPPLPRAQSLGQFLKELL